MKKTGIVGLCILFFGSVSFAQNPIDTTIVYPLEEISLFKKKENTAAPSDLVPATVIDKEILEKTNSESVAEAVQVSPGVILKDYGGVGGLKTVSVRSLGAEHTLVMLNGVKLTDAQTGVVDLGRVSVENVETINLYKGNPVDLGLPAIAYSSAAVLNVVFDNSKPVTKLPEAKIGITSGSFGYLSPSLFLKKSVGRNSWCSVAGVYRSSKGNYPFILENGEKIEELERKNADLEDVRVEGDFYTKFSPNTSLSVKGFYMQGERGLPGAVILYNPNFNERLWNKDFFLQAKLESKLKNGVGLNFYGKVGKSYLRYLDPDYHNRKGYLENEYDQKEAYLAASAYKSFNANLSISAASDVVYNYLTGDISEIEKPERLTSYTSAFLNYNIGKLSLQGGAVNTTFSDFNQNIFLEKKLLLTPAAFVGFDVLKNLKLRAFYKETYRLPTFNDLYYNFIGNTGLKPENTHNFNLGLSWKKDGLGFLDYIVAQSDLFYNQVRDKIIAVPTQNIFVWSMRNLGRVEGKGIELFADFAFKPVAKVKTSVTVSYTYQSITDVTSKSSPVYDQQIAYTPWETASVVTGFERGKIRVAHHFLFSGYRYALGENIPENFLPGFSTHDLSASYQFEKEKHLMTLRLEINNVFNSQYEVIKSFPMPGRHFKIKLTYHYA